MKINREQLKSLIKECLVEILNDGLAGSLTAQRPSSQMYENVVSKKKAIVPPRQKSRQFDPALDTPVSQASNRQVQALHETIKREAGGNSVMESILADTAMTTLQAMSAVDSGSPTAGARVVQQEHFAGNPEDVFGEEAASKWASLAFMDAPAKKTA